MGLEGSEGTENRTGSVPRRPAEPGLHPGISSINLETAEWEKQEKQPKSALGHADPQGQGSLWGELHTGHHPDTHGGLGTVLAAQQSPLSCPPLVPGCRQTYSALAGHVSEFQEGDTDEL